MAHRLLSKNLDGEFKERISESKEVAIASAWMTCSDALTALLNSPCDAKAIVGIHGNATTPASLQAFISRFHLSNLRIVDRGAVFHPKLYLFRRQGRSTVAWVGSANFTGGGLETNQELVMQLEGGRPTAQLEEWFNNLWRTLPSSRTAKLLAQYCETWEKPNRYLADIVQTRNRRPPPASHARPGSRYKYLYFDEPKWADSHAKIARDVLVRFAVADPKFLGKFAAEDAKRVAANKKARRRYIGTEADNVGNSWLSIKGRWRMGNNFQDYHFFEMLKIACRVMGVTYEDGDDGPVDYQAKEHRQRPGHGANVAWAKVGHVNEQRKLGG